MAYMCELVYYAEKRGKGWGGGAQYVGKFENVCVCVCGGGGGSKNALIGVLYRKRDVHARCHNGSWQRSKF